MISYILLVLIALSQLFLCAAKLEIFSAKFIDAINRNQTLGKAGKNVGDYVTKEFLRTLTTTVDPDKERRPNCETLKRVPFQGRCSNCWAAALAVALSSRLCIQSSGKYDYELSMDHVTRCCPVWDRRCANYENGCYGGYANYFHKFWTCVGIVSGGYHGSYEGCRPYSEF